MKGDYMLYDQIYQLHPLFPIVVFGWMYISIGMLMNVDRGLFWSMGGCVLTMLMITAAHLSLPLGSKLAVNATGLFEGALWFMVTQDRISRIISLIGISLVPFLLCL